MDMQKQVIRFYKPDVVKDFTKTLVRDKNLNSKRRPMRYVPPW